MLISKIYLRFVAMCFITLCSCTASRLDRALSLAGDNRVELEQVLEHYSHNAADALKLQAARFLIENMPGHYSYRGREILDYYEKIDPILNSQLPWEQKKDAIEKVAEEYPQLRQNTIQDVRIIKSDFLIRNIDQAFDSWNKPWARHLTFEQFCEYLLPYKVVELQQMDAWRDTLSGKFCEGLRRNKKYPDDDTKNSTYHAANTIHSEIQHRFEYNPIWRIASFSGYSFLSAGSIAKTPFGLCDDYVTMAVLIMRSHAIPAFKHFVPLWSKINNGHSWYGILHNNGAKYISHYEFQTNLSEDYFPHHTAPKIFMETYAHNPAVLDYYRKSSAPHHVVRPFQKDITDEYVATSTLEIPVKRRHLKDRYAYIAIFNDREWRPVDFGTVRRGKAIFENMGRDNLYIVLAYDGENLTPISNPFILHRNGELEYVIADTEHRGSVVLCRKYFLTPHVSEMHQRMIGGSIQASHTPDFENPITLYRLDSVRYADAIPLPDVGKYRYWRYLPPQNVNGNIAEVYFYKMGENEVMRGKIIGTEGNPDKEKDKAFDDDWLTYYDSDVKTPWVGMDFETPCHIGHVRLIPRTDDNNIHPGDEYELKYWDKGGWVSLGKQIATDVTLQYGNVPSGGLLWLSNITRGRQEQAFTYEHGEQVFW